MNLHITKKLIILHDSTKIQVYKESKKIVIPIIVSSAYVLDVLEGEVGKEEKGNKES